MSVAAASLLTSHGHRKAALRGGASQPAASAVTTAVPAVWQRPDAMIVDTSTGADYIYVGSTLRPVRNAVSAFLILGSRAPAEVRVPHATITAAGLGPPIGIANAPAFLASSSALMHGGWVLCAAHGSTIIVVGNGKLGTAGFAGYGSGLHGGDDLRNAAVAVRSAGDDYLIWERHRYRLSGPDQVFAALTWTVVAPLAIPAPVLDALPAGATMTAASIPTEPPIEIRATSTAALCVSFSAQGAALHVVVNPAVGTGVGSAHLVVAAHSAVLARSLSGSHPLYLVTDGGRRYEIADSAALSSLGYQNAAIVSMPADVLALLPRGPTLSHRAALNET